MKGATKGIRHRITRSSPISPIAPAARARSARLNASQNRGQVQSVMLPRIEVSTAWLREPPRSKPARTGLSVEIFRFSADFYPYDVLPLSGTSSYSTTCPSLRMLRSAHSTTLSRERWACLERNQIRRAGTPIIVRTPTFPREHTALGTAPRSRCWRWRRLRSLIQVPRPCRLRRLAKCSHFVLAL